ncbi:ABC transporter permease [Nocardioides sp.]|uniref:ABC transporter permease n=1 Tax=Nocardioides sp. TaxID=35761 RepID=UPI0039E44BD0
MTDIATTAPLPRFQPASATGPGGAAFRAILGRDLLVLRHGLVAFIVQVAVQPLLLVFTFTYVLPHVAGSGFAGYGTLLLPGLMAATAFSTGISAVTTPLALDLGGTREIDDRALAPISISTLALEKILIGAVYAWISGLLVIPIAMLVSANPIELHVQSWPVLVAALLLVGLTASALGLVIGTVVKPHQIGMLYGVFVIPIQFLGCTYYPWSALHDIPWVQALTLIDPLTYFSEATRAAITSQVGHLPTGISLGVTAILTVVLTWTGVRLLTRRIRT